MAAFEQLHHAGKILIGLDDCLRIVFAAQGLDFFDRHSEQEEIFLADGFADFDVGAVQRADRNGAVHHELHVARAGCFLAGCRDLLRQVGGRADQLHSRHLVIGIEHEAQSAVHFRVRINHSGNVVDRLDDVLGHHVTGRSLAADDDRARHEVIAVAAADAVIQVDRMQQVEQLALVLVDAFDLYIEQHVGRDVQAGLLLDVVCKPLLVGELDGAPVAMETLVVGKLAEIFEHS